MNIIKYYPCIDWHAIERSFLLHSNNFVFNDILGCLWGNKDIFLLFKHPRNNAMKTLKAPGFSRHNFIF